jgi:hypothetical protein
MGIRHKRVPVTMAWHMARPQVSVVETASSMKGIVNKPLLNKQSHTADKGSFSRLVFGNVLTTHRKTLPCYKQLIHNGRET